MSDTDFSAEPSVGEAEWRKPLSRREQIATLARLFARDLLRLAVAALALALFAGVTGLALWGASLVLADRPASYLASCGAALFGLLFTVGLVGVLDIARAYIVAFRRGGLR